MATKYAEIVDTLRDEIVRGHYPPNSRLPTEAELGSRFEASRGTVRRAQPWEQGLVERAKRGPSPPTLGLGPAAALSSQDRWWRRKPGS